MLLKWLFTILAVLWLIQALRPYFNTGPGLHQKPPNSSGKQRNDDDDSDYIDYEEIK